MKKYIIILISCMVLQFIMGISVYAMDTDEEPRNSILAKPLAIKYLSTHDSSTDSALQKWIFTSQEPILHEDNDKDALCISCFRTHCPKDNGEKIIAIGGNLLGAVSPIAHWNLSRDFWLRFVDNEGGAVVLASLSAIPILTIGAHTTKEEALRIKRSIQQLINEKEIRNNPTFCNVLKKIPIEFFKIVGGVSWSIGYAYIDYLYYYPSIGSWSAFIIVPTFITSVNAGYWGIDHNVDAFINFSKAISKKVCKKDPIQQNTSAWKAAKLKEQLERARRQIGCMSDEEVETLINQNNQVFYKIIFQSNKEYENESEYNSCTSSHAIKKYFKQRAGALE